MFAINTRIFPPHIRIVCQERQTDKQEEEEVAVEK
jgi:hypothetical protein